MPATETESELDVISMRWYALSADEVSEILFEAYWCAKASQLSDGANPDIIYSALTYWSFHGQSREERQAREEFGKTKLGTFEDSLRKRGLIK